MKKVALFLISFVLASVTVEIFLQYVVGFPTYEVEKKLTGIRSAFSGTQNVFKPNSKYFTVEGGMKIFKRNNLGLPGLDVDTSRGKKYIAILGNSFLEAYQFPPWSTAVGILQQKLHLGSPNFEVINLGVSGHDPFDLLYRVNYYGKKFTFEKVVLVITSSQADWLKRHLQIKFEGNLPVLQNKTTLSKILISLRNNSVLIDLLAKTFKAKEEQNDALSVKPQKANPTKLFYDAEYDVKLKNILEEYNKMFGEKFIVVNIASNEEVAIPMKARQYLKDSGIRYKFNPINYPENQINRRGHLNLAGNAKLGKILYEVLQ